LFLPRGDGSFGFGVLAPDEAYEDIEAPYGKEEKGGDEGEGVGMVGEDGCSDEALKHA